MKTVTSEILFKDVLNKTPDSCPGSCSARWRRVPQGIYEVVVGPDLVRRGGLSESAGPTATT